MITLYHATTKRRLRGIQAKGLLRSKSRGVRKVVWCVPATGVMWAVSHVQKRHRVGLGQVIVLTIEVDPEVLRVHTGSLFYSLEDVKPEAIRLVQSAEELC